MISGIVRDCKINEPLAGAIVTMKNINDARLCRQLPVPDGKFSFEVTGRYKSTIHLTLSKENYKERMTLRLLKSSTSRDLMIDIYINVPICINKMRNQKKNNWR